ncbi:diacylglycerol/lipid kinase family protein [Halorussus lipolyticus]|uniref:diacylglycerol/lipid kinase family protein n=1 Tax=Halorussus lipolyticus TaxID=3034024 RepID=UPI0023E79FFC|nr:YegS/Rv2252/BmrU family lipid kinase [Halorussus sp. DT80]
MPEIWEGLAGDEVGTGDEVVADEVVADGGVPDDRVLVLNPVSGDGDHRERVRKLADEAGFTVLETHSAGEAVTFGRLAGEAGADVVAAAGGDGTINEVVRGLDAADAFEDVTFGVVPTGTGNNFAGNLGTEDIRHAFEVLMRGERRRIDVATAGDDELFVNSCIAGLTAEASASTSPEMKDRLGMLAYVVSGLRAVREFDALPLSVEAECPTDADEKSWSGEAVMVLVGNARRFPAEGRSQANCEDGLLEATIIERMPSTNLLEEAALHRLFGDETEHVTRLLASELHIDVRRDEPVGFSFDGETGEYDALAMGTRQQVLEVCVGDDYEPNPE